MIKIVAVDHKYVPSYKTEGSACADLVAYLEKPLLIGPGKVGKIPVGFSIQLEAGWEMQIRCRSGLASRGIMVANGIGTIDSDYRGPVAVLIYNSTECSWTVEDGDRIAQMSVQRTYRFQFDIVEKLDESERADGGFGSTGIR